MNANHVHHDSMRDMHMNFSQLQSFVAVAETGSFTEAAYTIDLTQSAGRHPLAALESELGVPLPQRNHTSGGAPTHPRHSILPPLRAAPAPAETIQPEAQP